MIKALIKTNTELRIETLEDVKAYQEELRAIAKEQNFQVTSYTWTLKEVKVKGEVIDEYYQVKYLLTFNDIKNPDSYLNDIEYKMVGSDDIVAF